MKNKDTTLTTDSDPTDILLFLKLLNVELEFIKYDKFSNITIVQKLDTILEFLEDASVNLTNVEILQSISKYTKVLKHIKSQAGKSMLRKRIICNEI